MPWRLVEVSDAEAKENDLTDSELIGVSVLLTHRAGEPHTDMNVYWRAREKIQEAVEVALSKSDEEPEED